MSRSALPRTMRARRRVAAAALVVALPFTMAAGCEEEAGVEPGMEQEGEQEGGTEEEDD